jgi:hypothetical protein
MAELFSTLRVVWMFKIKNKKSNLTKFRLELMFRLESSQSKLPSISRVAQKAYETQAQAQVPNK